MLLSDPDADLQVSDEALVYGFDLWAEQVEAFCRQIVQRPVLLVGNSIGGVVVLRAAQRLGVRKGVVLIDCAQRLMDDQLAANRPGWPGSGHCWKPG